MEDKKWFTSKTLWVNALAVIGSVVQGVTGSDIMSPADQGIFLGVVNLILRMFTSKKLTA